MAQHLAGKRHLLLIAEGEQQRLDAQEQWVTAHGYQARTVKSCNQFSAMLRWLLRNGYLIEKCKNYEPLTESRLYFIKTFQK